MLEFKEEEYKENEREKIENEINVPMLPSSFRVWCLVVAAAVAFLSCA